MVVGGFTTAICTVPNIVGVEFVSSQYSLRVCAYIVALLYPLTMLCVCHWLVTK